MRTYRAWINSPVLADTGIRIPGRSNFRRQSVRRLALHQRASLIEPSSSLFRRVTHGEWPSSATRHLVAENILDVSARHPQCMADLFYRLATVTKPDNQISFLQTCLDNLVAKFCDQPFGSFLSKSDDQRTVVTQSFGKTNTLPSERERESHCCVMVGRFSNHSCPARRICLTLVCHGDGQVSCFRYSVI